MAGPTGFEPATSRLTIWRPNQAERRPLETLSMAEDRNDKTISSGRSSPELLHDVCCLLNPVCVPNTNGRRNRDRTCDLCLVRAALSQLSYPPDFLNKLAEVTKSPWPCQPVRALFLQNISSIGCLGRISAGLPGKMQPMDLLQSAALHLCIDLSRGNARMAQHGLNSAQIGPPLQ
jgi:hypothetical protein